MPEIRGLPPKICLILTSDDFNWLTVLQDGCTESNFSSVTDH